MSTEKELEKYKAAFNRCDFKLKEEKPLYVKKQEIIGLEGIISAYEKIVPDILTIGEPLTVYNAVLSTLLMEKKSYNSEAVSLFCENIKMDNWQILGVYISALINNIIKEDETIIIEPIISLSWLGYAHSRGSLVISNSVGTFTGCTMGGGKITIKGNAGSFTGSNMRGGEIEVDGNADYNNGSKMIGGRITINGNSGKDTGFYMHGGEILVNGQIESLSKYIPGGEVWQAGKKVYPRNIFHKIKRLIRK